MFKYMNVTKKYKVSFVVYKSTDRGINMGETLEYVVAASSKAAAVIWIVSAYIVCKILSVERVNNGTQTGQI